MRTRYELWFDWSALCWAYSSFSQNMFWTTYLEPEDLLE